MKDFYTFIKDPRIEKAKKEILEVIDEKRQTITGVRPPQIHKEEEFQALIKSTSELRGANLYYPYIGSGFGNGPLVELADGSVKYDFISGIGVHYWGHSNLELMSANIDAALTDTVMQGHLQQNADSTKLMHLLTDSSGFDHCFLTTSGAMANENGLKILFQNQHPKDRILAFHHCFMGRTITLAQITDKPAYRAGLPHTVHVDYIPFYDPKRPEESTEEAIQELKKHLKQHPGKYAVMCMELVQGEGGFNVGSKAFFHAIIDILKRENIKVLVDEVQTFGRTPKLFAFQYFELEGLVDVVTIGKLSQVCATLFNQEIAPKPGLLSQTFTASTSSIHSGTLIVDTLIHGDFYGPNGKINAIHEYFAKQLEALHRKYPDLIEGPWGIGAMVAFTPFKGDKEKVMHFAQKLFEEGVISFIAGSDTLRIRFLLPIKVINKDHIDDVVHIIEKALLA